MTDQQRGIRPTATAAAVPRTRAVERVGSVERTGAAGQAESSLAAALRDDGDGAAVLCQDLVRVYTAEGVEVQALQGLSLRIEPGELVAIVGASGSGKSTLLSILSGIDQPTAGTARVAGHQLVGMARKERVTYQRDAVGFVWQQTARNLLPYLTAAENIGIVLAVAGHRNPAARVAELLDMTNAGDEADKHPAEMSGGQQQRVAIAVALANNPQVLLADEPTGELDEESTAQVLGTIRSINEEVGITTLIVTHDAGVSEHVRRTIQIRDGRIAAETLRHSVSHADGREELIAEDFAVLDRVGRMQLPPEMVRSLGLRDRVRLHQQDDHVAVFPRQSEHQQTAGDDAEYSTGTRGGADRQDGQK